MNYHKNIILKPKSILFILLILVFCLTATNDVGNSNSMYKYIVLLLCIIDSYFRYMKLIRKNKNTPLFKKELKYFLILILIIVIYSGFKIIISSMYSFRIIQELLFLICPMLYGYLLINTSEKKEIDFNMKLSFILVFFLYIVSLGLDYKTIIYSLFNSSFADSSSALESHTYSGLSLAYCFYFCFFDKKNRLKFISVLFVLMTFKRLSILVAIFLCIFSFTKMKDKLVSKKIYIIIALGLSFFSILYYNIMLPKNVEIIEYKYNIDISKLTSTRSDRMMWLYYSDYESYGFGSSTEYMYNKFYGALEMDLIKIIVELGFLPAIVLIFTYLYIGKFNYYLFIFMSFQILSLTFSSNLTTSISWSLIFITIFSIKKFKGGVTYNEKEILNHNSRI